MRSAINVTHTLACNYVCSDKRKYKLNQLLATADAVTAKYHCFAMQLSVTAVMVC